MSLESILNRVAESEKGAAIKDEISEERLQKILPKLKQQIAFYRAYPDIFIDDLTGYSTWDPEKGEWKGFQFYYFQRITLRTLMRHRKTYIVFSRGFSKSFISLMSLMIKAVLYPGSELFVTTGGKQQAASISVSKIEEICKLIPALANEINWDRGVTKHAKDVVKYVFKNGSYIDVLPALESSRGQRRTGGLFEECVLIDQDALNDIIIPCCVINRRLPNGKRVPQEVVNQCQTYITTAGYKDSFSYRRLIEILAESILNPDEAMILGGTYEIPVNEGLQPKDFIQQLKLQGTFDESSFEREWCSKWTGNSEKSFFSSEAFDKCRELLLPELKYSDRSSKNAYYIVAADIGRKIDTSEAAIIKVTPQPQGPALKSVVCFYSLTDAIMREQAIWLKKLFFQYNARALVVDGNGLGIGLTDELVLGQEDPKTGEYYPPFGVLGGTYENAGQEYKKYKTEDTIKDVLYIVKANSPMNTEAYAYLKTQLNNRRIKFLIEEREAKLKLQETKVGQNMSVEERAERLLPYQLTDNLKSQMMNLVEENEGVNIILNRESRGIPKDRFSALLYGMYFIKKEEEKSKKRKGRDLSQFLFFT